MRKILLIGDSSFLNGTDIGEDITSVANIGQAMSVIKKGNKFTTILIEYPSERDGAAEFTEYISKNNNYIFSTAILIITDDEHIEKDSAFLGGVVVDCFQKPINKNIFLNRIKNSEKLIGSVSFTEFSGMLKALPANIYLKDENGRYVFASQTWSHVDSGDDPEWNICGKTDLEIRKDKDNARLALESDMKIIRTGKGTSYIIEENTNGKEYLQLIKEPLFSGNGKVTGIIALINDITEQETLRRKLRDISIHDQMTGFFNRSYLDEYIRGIKNEKRYPLSVISADCDNLKFINDNYGHMMGDEYIKLCVSLMKGILPDKSCIFRTGGDEFLAFLPETSSTEADILIEKIKSEQASFSVKGINLSVSVGYSTITGESDSIAECIKLSDNDMYRDKRLKKEKNRS